MTVRCIPMRSGLSADRIDAPTISGGYVTGYPVHGPTGEVLGVFMPADVLRRMVSPKIADRIFAHQGNDQ